MASDEIEQDGKVYKIKTWQTGKKSWKADLTVVGDFGGSIMWHTYNQHRHWKTRADAIASVVKYIVESSDYAAAVEASTKVIEYRA